jgi:2-polyprenyl-6-methoxyphenol hydroxylase-like FAD-dependent oxidoreductase
MKQPYDAVVVGARCAGASTALLLARRGHRVLLVDRARFPSEIRRGHFVHRDGPRRLQRWGVLDRIVATGCPPVSSSISNLGDFPLLAEDLVVDGVAWGYGPRRGLLDKILVDAALDAGAELCEEFAFEQLLTDGDRVVGIRGRPAGGSRTVELRARLTIGADGCHSGVARAVGAPVQAEAAPSLACWYFSYWSGVRAPHMELHVLPERRAIFAFRTNDDLFAIFVGWPITDFPRVRANLEGSFLAVLDLVPDLAARVRAGRRAERFYGTGDVPNFLRTPAGPGWALVGDAACHKDPFLALGVADALRDAELLAEAAHAGLSGAQPLDSALAGYHRRRDAATLPGYRDNLQAARFQPPPPEVLRLRAAVRHSPLDTRQFFLASRDMIPRAEFFNEPNLARLLGTGRAKAA